MFNIMKAQIYQTLRNNFIYYVLFALLCIFIVPELVSMDPEIRTGLNGSMGLMLYAGSLPLACELIALLLTTHICGTDQTDHTINYEIMNGTRRSTVYFGRVLVSVMFCFVSAAIVIALPILIAGLYGGEWGVCITGQDALRRSTAALAPFIRSILFFAFTTFLIGDGKLAMVMNILLTFVASLLFSVMDEMNLRCMLLDHLTGLSAMYRLFDVSNKRISYVGDKAYWIVSEALQQKDALQTVLISLSISAVLLAAGLLLFRRKDLK